MTMTAIVTIAHSKAESMCSGQDVHVPSFAHNFVRPLRAWNRPPQSTDDEKSGVAPVRWRVHRFRNHTGDSSRFSYAMGDR